MRGENWVCLEHRVASRTNYLHGSNHCPVDGSPMTSIGTRWRVPKKNDDEGWAGVYEFIKDREHWREWHNERPLERNPLWRLGRAEELLKRWKREG